MPVIKNILASSDFLEKFPIAKDGIFSVEIEFTSLTGTLDGEISIETTMNNGAESGVTIPDSLTTVDDANKRIILNAENPIKGEFVFVRFLSNSITGGTANIYFRS
jgi:hypothetical protein